MSFYQPSNWNENEWSEVYALFKLLGDKELFLGDKDVEKLEGLVYPIIKVLRTGKQYHNFSYTCNIFQSGTI